jgi:uncharacterized protein Yka (UPF0111/DUF47 family)
MAVYQLSMMVRVWQQIPNRKGIFIKIISKHDMEADKIRREMVTVLSNREIYPNERDDLMCLVRAVDWIIGISRSG